MEEYYNVLNVLKNSKKYWDKPPLDYGPDNPEVKTLLCLRLAEGY